MSADIFDEPAEILADFSQFWVLFFISLSIFMAEFLDEFKKSLFFELRFFKHLLSQLVSLDFNSLVLFFFEISAQDPFQKLYNQILIFGEDLIVIYLLQLNNVDLTQLLKDLKAAGVDITFGKQFLGNSGDNERDIGWTDQFRQRNIGFELR